MLKHTWIKNLIIRQLKKNLKWVHIAISNAKKTLLGVFHKIKVKYLQAYLYEFCYKLNLKYFGEKLFDRCSNSSC